MIRNNVKKLCDERGITIAELSRLSGLARTVLTRIFHNQVTNINFETLNALCRGLDVDLQTLLPYVPEELMTDEDKEHVKERAEAVAAYTEMRRRNANK